MNNRSRGGSTESKVTITAKTIKPMAKYVNFFLKIPDACLAFTMNPIPLNIKIENMKTIKKQEVKQEQLLDVSIKSVPGPPGGGVYSKEAIGFEKRKYS